MKLTAGEKTTLTVSTTDTTRIGILDGIQRIAETKWSALSTLFSTDGRAASGELEPGSPKG